MSLWQHLGIRSSSKNKQEQEREQPTTLLHPSHGSQKLMCTNNTETVASTSHSDDKMVGMDLELGTSRSGDNLPVVAEEQDPEDSSSHSSSNSYQHMKFFAGRTSMIAALILLVGAGASALILGAGIGAANREQKAQFEGMSLDLMSTFQTAVGEYETAGLWIHQACVQRRDSITHQEFRTVYEYIVSTGLQLQAISFAMNVTSMEEREGLENRTREYLQEAYPNLMESYVGIKGFTPGAEKPGRMPELDYYYPVHFVEPMEDIKNQFAVDFDIRTSGVRRVAVEEAVATGKPAMTTRLKLIQEGQEGTDAYAYSTIIMHPGIPLSNATPAAARRTLGDVTVVVIRIPEVLERARQNFNLKESASLYIFDSTSAEEPPAFLGGARFSSDQEGSGVEFHNELELEEVKETEHRYLHQERIRIASKEWTFVVVACKDTYVPAIAFVVLGASLVFLACLALALWVVTNHQRLTKINQIRAQADAEKAKLMVDNAREAAKKERDLNDFLSHEVRNPISAAISACSFVESALQECRKNTVSTNDSAARFAVEDEDLQCIEEDVSIIDSSLSFVNDLLRNMLDMHRAASGQLNIAMEPCNLLRDILEPVASILYQRGAEFQVLLDCPEDLILMTDKLRLKQTALNLGRNATKFVSKGFVRLRACVVDNKVHLFIEDSGPGIPMEKRNKLFGQFQEALDTLSQGTGMGLSLCKKLVELMDGHLSLDETYDSGMPGCPGACFVIDLNTPPLSMDTFDNDDSCDNLIQVSGRESESHPNTATPGGRQLPESLSVLFCDGDWKLRTNFSKALSRVTKGWKIREASSGETALRLVEDETFDIVFMDQYFSSVVKQLLGTETVHSMRSRGVSSSICGMSASDAQIPFQQAGADCFALKPLPTDTEKLTKLLCHILDSGAARNANPQPSLLSRASKPKNSQTLSSSQKSASQKKLNSPTSTPFDLADSLPKTLKVWFVDDDARLRQLYNRSLRRIAPEWTVTECPDGESALEMVDSATQPDLMFIDMYMPQSQREKPLLGTETAKAMRAKGVTSVICGLSANNVQKEFLAAGADCFQMKPFPCEKEELTRELVRILGPNKLTFPLSSSLPEQANPALPPTPLPTPLGPSASLPPNMSVLFVDDSPMIRKLFARCIKRATMGWTVEEAETGVSALEIVAKNQSPSSYDFIFLDQHTNSSLSGTETCRKLRDMGVTSLICGCSGDDIEGQFLEAGADSFWMKPVPCEKDQLASELVRILYCRKTKPESSEVIRVEDGLM